MNVLLHEALCFCLMPLIFQVSEEAKYIKASKMDRTQQIQELHSRVDENSGESSSKKAFEDDIQSSLNSVLASDDSRLAEFNLTYEEKQQNVAVSIKYIYVFLNPAFSFIKYVKLNQLVKN